MELNGLFPIIRRWALVIVASTFLAALVGVILSTTGSSTYEAKADLLIGPLSTDTETIRASGTLSQTYAELATSGAVLDAVSKATDVPTSELKSGVRVTANSATRFITVRARSSDASTAAAIANAVTAEMISQSRSDESRPEGELRLIDPATKPSAPSSARAGLIVPLAAVAGLLGALALVLLLEYLSDGAETVEKVEAITGLSAIDTTERNRRDGSKLLVDEVSPRTLAQYRVMATQVELSCERLRSVLVAGAGDHDGSAVVATNLAVALAARHQFVVLVDAGAGDVTTLCSAESVPGLSNLIVGPDDVDPVLYEPEGIPIAMVAQGTEGDGESITMGQALRIVDAIASVDGVVVVHGASPVLSAGTLVWARIADATVLAVRRFQTRRTTIAEAMTNLGAVGARTTLAVLHDARRPAGPALERSGTTGRPLPATSAADRTTPNRSDAGPKPERRRSAATASTTGGRS